MMFAMVLGVVDDEPVQQQLLGHVVDVHTQLVLVEVVVDKLDRQQLIGHVVD